MLTAAGIKEAMQKGYIVIDPFNEHHLQSNSYDITVGSWVCRYNTTPQNLSERLGDFPIRKLRSERDKDRLFQKPQHCGREIVVAPYERILCHTREVFGTVDKYVAQLATRSTLARWGIDICGSAGFGDVGFVNHWTMELQNQTGFSLVIPVGARVGQVFFSPVEGVVERKYEGVYIRGRPFDFLEWKPEDMLPKIVLPED